jgi:hypothetical protein
MLLSEVNTKDNRPQQMEKPRIFSVTVPGDVYQRLRKLAVKRDEKLAALVRRMIKTGLPEFEESTK